MKPKIVRNKVKIPGEQIIGENRKYADLNRWDSVASVAYIILLYPVDGEALS